MKRQGKALCGICLVAALILSVLAPTTQAAKKKVKLSNKKIAVTVGKKKILKVKNTTKKVKWSIKSGKKNIKLSKKKKKSVVIQGKKKGKAVVLAKIGKKKLTCKITVKPAAKETEEANEPAPEKIFRYEGLDTSWIDPNKPMVAFTFDDGPIGSAEDSSGMIIQNALKKYGAHATFFYIGGQINSESKKEEVRKAHENGFEVGNHSWEYFSLSYEEESYIKNSVSQTNDVLKEITGYSNFLFRAPNLSICDTMLSCIDAPFINCSVDSKDYTTETIDGVSQKLSKESIIANVKQAKDGDIVLMHENTNTYQAIDEILNYFVKEKGYQVVSVSELYAVRGEYLLKGETYTNCPATK